MLFCLFLGHFLVGWICQVICTSIAPIRIYLGMAQFFFNVWKWHINDTVGAAVEWSTAALHVAGWIPVLKIYFYGLQVVDPGLTLRIWEFKFLIVFIIKSIYSILLIGRNLASHPLSRHNLFHTIFPSFLWSYYTLIGIQTLNCPLNTFLIPLHTHQNQHCLFQPFHLIYYILILLLHVLVSVSLYNK